MEDKVKVYDFDNNSIYYIDAKDFNYDKLCQIFDIELNFDLEEYDG